MTTMQRITQTQIELAKILIEAAESIGRPVEPKYRALARAKPTPPWDVPYVEVPGVGPALDFTPSNWRHFDNLREPAKALAAGYNVLLRDFGEPHFIIALRGGLDQPTKDANLHALNRLDADVPEGMHDLFWEVRKMASDPEVTISPWREGLAERTAARTPTPKGPGSGLGMGMGMGGVG